MEIFIDVVGRTLDDPNINLLVQLANAAGTNEHGAMLIISSDAAAEAKRLSRQVWGVKPVPLPIELIGQLTNIDGGVLVDPQGRCHAIGVILDGVAKGVGAPARSSRFNSAVRYTGGDAPPAVVVVYSTDGTINMLPELMPVVRRGDVFAAVRDYLLAAMGGLIVRLYINAGAS